jgi:outer membrane protein assembly factor BamA
MRFDRSAPPLILSLVCIGLAGPGATLAQSSTDAKQPEAPGGSTVTDPAPQPVPGDAELEKAGAVFGEIRIDNKNVFDRSDPKDNKALFRLADKLHVRTRESVIRHQLLFRSGTPYSRHAIEESARILRSDNYFYDAAIVPIRYHDGKVDVLVTTRDVWTLDPGFNYSRSGGTNSTGVYVEELNLAGTGSKVSISHQSGVDRSQTGASFSNMHAFGTWTAVNLNYAQLSDGLMRSAIINSPFYALETRHAGGVTAQADDHVDYLYDRGEIIDKFHDHGVFAQAYAGWSAGLQNGWVTRWSAGMTYDERRFYALPSWTGPTVLPQDRKFVYPWIRFDLLEDRYVKLENRDQIGRTEDFYLGTNVTLRLGWADAALGSSRSALLLQTAAGKGAMLSDDATLLATSVFTGRLEGGTLKNGVLDGAIRYYLQQSKKWLFFTTVHAAKGWNLDVENQLLLGGDNGLRGYPLRYQDGTARALTSVEERWFSDWFPFRLFRVGAAVFADVGRTWGQAPLAAPGLGLLEDAGFGLRFGNARSAFGNVVHVDVAFPLHTRPGVDTAQFLVQTEASF